MKHSKDRCAPVKYSKCIKNYLCRDPLAPSRCMVDINLPRVLAPAPLLHLALLKKPTALYIKTKIKLFQNNAFLKEIQFVFSILPINFSEVT